MHKKYDTMGSARIMLDVMSDLKRAWERHPNRGRFDWTGGNCLDCGSGTTSFVGIMTGTDDPTGLGRDIRQTLADIDIKPFQLIEAFKAESEAGHCVFMGLIVPWIAEQLDQRQKQ